jgi:Tol biopolymer transport system component
MPLSTGYRLGFYEIRAPIGAGGMGEVYRAGDTKLKRDVALKILPEAFARDADRMLRFQREAEVLASLNHPNIASIYGVEESSGTRALVMELAPGPTLAERISDGPIPEDEAIHIARQIAEALEYAHEKGVIHRDLKPANVKITPEGAVKILDFGLAKALSGDDSAITGDAGNSPTLTMGATKAGVILGTAAYMSPEQARGKNVDRRADIWAFGVVLAEMLTGKRLFRGEDMSEILASVIKEEPRWETVPERFRPLLRRCLEKDPRRRLRDIGDAMALLEATATPIAVQSAAAPARRPWAAWTAAVLFFVLAAAAVPFSVAHLREKPAVAQPMRFEIPAPPKASFEVYTSLSPDGRRLAFTAYSPDGVPRIWIRDLETLQARQLAGTENPASLWWSPDSRYVAFGRGQQLKKIDVAGGPAQTLCESKNAVGSGAWSKSDVIVFGGRGTGPLQQVSSAGGTPSPLTQLDTARQETFHSFPSFLPDGRHFVYFRRSSNVENSSISLGSLDAKPEEQNSKRLIPSQFSAAYAASSTPGAGHLLFLRDGTLMAQAFDEEKLELTGEPVPVAEQVGSSNQYGNFSASANDVLAYRTGAAGTLQLTWFDRNGKSLGTVGEPSLFARLALSPDSTRAAVRRSTASGDLWLMDFMRGVSTRFTFDPSQNDFPVWSPDGSRIVFHSNRGSRFDLYQKASNGAGTEELLLKSDQDKTPTAFSRDGRFLLFSSQDPKNGTDLWVLPMEGDRKPVPVLQTEFNERNAMFSPDMRWIAYGSNESGRAEVYVRPFAAPGSGTSATSGKWQVSKDGGDFPHWRQDGKELYFRLPGGAVMAVQVTPTPTTFEAGVPHVLFNYPAQAGVEPAPDGNRFLVEAFQQDQAAAPITVVLNWQSALRK